MQPAWNCYAFESYRTPAIPLESFDFALKEYAWNRQKQQLHIVLENGTDTNQFQVGITAVIEGAKGIKNYYALKHSSEKPDFHVLDSFILERD